jgi:transposase InsO family protein
LIEAEKANYPITMMCALLGLARSTYYAWTRRAGCSATAARRAELTRLVGEVFDEYRGTYGCRRIARVLNADRGVPVSVGTVADIMREQGLAAVQPRAYKRTTLPGEKPVVAPDRIGRDFTAEAPGTRLVGDITYLRTGEGWLYLATVIDLCTRMVVGWAMAEHLRTELVVDALEMARIHGHLAPGAVFHSDRGCQYTSGEFAEYCKENGILRSLGRTGICYDNAAAESFFATLKNEMYYRQTFDTRARARFAVAEYIEVFYNRKRHHSTLGYRTPAQALAEHHQTATAA